jgi:general secretion pathway protein G
MPNVRLHACLIAPRLARGGGFTLLELMTVMAVVGLLTAIALPSYAAIIERQKVGQAGLDLQEIAMLIERYRTLQFSVPENLDDLGRNLNLPKDPWGRDYQFLNFNSPEPGVNGKIRKDHNLHPLNSEFDLYSLGKDGQSQAPLTARASRDDVIWARDGAFVGLAEDY